MYSAEIMRVLQILGSPKRHVFSEKAEIVALQSAADAGLCLHVPRADGSPHVVKEPYGWSDEGVAVVLTAIGRKELERLGSLPQSGVAQKPAVNPR